MSTHYLLKLYVANGDPVVEKLARALSHALEKSELVQFDLQVTDILKDVQKAVADGVFATPTLIRELSAPTQRLIGDLSDPHHILLLLGLIQQDSPGHND